MENEPLQKKGIMKIGFFDSGMGGLTILSAVRKLMPQYDYIYFGDTKNLPYGDKSEEEIQELTYIGIKRLFDAGSAIVIVACNTASAESVRKHQDGMLTKEYPDRKLLGVIVPTVEELVHSSAQNALLVATERTIHSKKYEIEIAKLEQGKVHFTLQTLATPLLVPMIEAGNIENACEQLSQLLDTNYKNIDTVIFGCTHYTLLKDTLRAQSNRTFISQDEIIPEKLQLYLSRHPEIENRLSQEGSVEVTLSAQKESYEPFLKTLNFRPSEENLI